MCNSYVVTRVPAITSVARPARTRRQVGLENKNETSASLVGFLLSAIGTIRLFFGDFIRFKASKKIGTLWIEPPQKTPNIKKRQKITKNRYTGVFDHGEFESEHGFLIRGA